MSLSFAKILPTSLLTEAEQKEFDMQVAQNLAHHRTHPTSKEAYRELLEGKKKQLALWQGMANPDEEARGEIAKLLARIAELESPPAPDTHEILKFENVEEAIFEIGKETGRFTSVEKIADWMKRRAQPVLSSVLMIETSPRRREIIDMTTVMIASASTTDINFAAITKHMTREEIIRFKALYDLAQDKDAVAHGLHPQYPDLLNIDHQKAVEEVVQRVKQAIKAWDLDNESLTYEILPTLWRHLEKKLMDAVPSELFENTIDDK